MDAYVDTLAADHYLFAMTFYWFFIFSKVDKSNNTFSNLSDPLLTSLFLCTNKWQPPVHIWNVLILTYNDMVW